MVCICRSALELPWFHGLIICIVQFIDVSKVVTTCPVRALSLSTDKYCGGPVIVKILCIRASDIALAVRSLVGIANTKFVLLARCQNYELETIETFWHVFNINC